MSVLNDPARFGMDRGGVDEKSLPRNAAFGSNGEPLIAVRKAGRLARPGQGRAIPHQRVWGAWGAASAGRAVAEAGVAVGAAAAADPKRHRSPM
jgi:hypothetical protein